MTQLDRQGAPDPLSEPFTPACGITRVLQQTFPNWDSLRS